MTNKLSNLPKTVTWRISKCIMCDIYERYADDIVAYL